MGSPTDKATRRSGGMARALLLPLTVSLLAATVSGCFILPITKEEGGAIRKMMEMPPGGWSPSPTPTPTPSADEPADQESPTILQYVDYAGTYVHPEGTIILKEDGSYTAIGGGNTMHGTYTVKGTKIYFTGDNGVKGTGKITENAITNRYGRFEKQ